MDTETQTPEQIAESLLTDAKAGAELRAAVVYRFRWLYPEDVLGDLLRYAGQIRESTSSPLSLDYFSNGFGYGISNTMFFIQASVASFEDGGWTIGDRSTAAYGADIAILADFFCNIRKELPNDELTKAFNMCARIVTIEKLLIEKLSKKYLDHSLPYMPARDDIPETFTTCRQIIFRQLYLMLINLEDAYVPYLPMSTWETKFIAIVGDMFGWKGRVEPFTRDIPWGVAHYNRSHRI